MRPLIKMSTIQIEITNACMNDCANCTRFVHHVPKNYFMSMEQFKESVDSLVGLPHTCLMGIMGGEPLLHPQFEDMCRYAATKFPKEQIGLWTCLPEGKERYRDVICECVGNIFINDHTRNDIMHAPLLVSASEVSDMEDWGKWLLIDECFAQNQWSASINPHGAFFCELAASLSMLLSDSADGWKVESGWWKRSPKDFVPQMEKYCMTCGFAMPLKKRCSTEGIDDISPKMYQRLEKTSPKLKKGKYCISDCKPYVGQCGDLMKQPYKDPLYREKIAGRYGMFLTLNPMQFNTPHLFRQWERKDHKEKELVCQL
jgi:hypothetical protein